MRVSRFVAYTDDEIAAIGLREVCDLKADRAIFDACPSYEALRVSGAREWRYSLLYSSSFSAGCLFAHTATGAMSNCHSLPFVK